MIGLRYILLLLLLIFFAGCKDKNIESNTNPTQENNQKEEVQVIPNNNAPEDYPDVNNLDEILSYSIPENTERVKLPLVSDGGQAFDFMLNGQLVGRKTYYSNGNTASSGPYKEGKMHGRHNGWYENGKLRFEMFYDMGIPCYWSRFWHENGQLKTEVYMIDGLQHGKYRQWNSEGKLLGETEFNMGTGEGIDWYENGNIQRRVHIVNGKPHGIMKYWDEKGNLLEDSISYFVNGKDMSREAYEEAQKTDTSLPGLD